MTVGELISKLEELEDKGHSLTLVKDYDNNDITDAYVLTYPINDYRKEEEHIVRIV